MKMKVSMICPKCKEKIELRDNEMFRDCDGNGGHTFTLTKYGFWKGKLPIEITKKEDESPT